MEAALTEVCKDIRVGKILIQTSRETGEPELYYLRLPKGISSHTRDCLVKSIPTNYPYISYQDLNIINYNFRYQGL